MSSISLRKVASVAIAVALLAPGGSATAAGKRRIAGSFTARAVPYPVYEDGRNCAGGIEGVHKTSHPFRAPAMGRLRADMAGFAGDWELFITGPDGRKIWDSSLGDNVQGPAVEHVELWLLPRERVQIMACNWAGQPEVEVTYEFVAGRPT